MVGPFLGRRIVVAGALASSLVRAQESGLPAGVQADLIAKVALYDKNFLVRAGGRAIVIAAARRAIPDSMRAAEQIVAALKDEATIGGLPHDQVVHEYVSPARLLSDFRARHAAILYFGPGFTSEFERLRDTFDGVSALTVTSEPSDITTGAVLALALVRGKPKLILNRQQARRQMVDFSSDVLRLMVLVQ